MIGLKLFLIPRETISCLITKDQLPKLSMTPDISMCFLEKITYATIKRFMKGADTKLPQRRQLKRKLPEL